MVIFCSLYLGFGLEDFKLEPIKGNNGVASKLSKVVKSLIKVIILLLLKVEPKSLRHSVEKRHFFAKGKKTFFLPNLIKWKVTVVANIDSCQQEEQKYYNNTTTATTVTAATTVKTTFFYL